MSLLEPLLQRVPLSVAATLKRNCRRGFLGVVNTAVLSLLLYFPTTSFAAPAPHQAETKISVIGQSLNDPGWMQLWRQARQQTAEADVSAAISSYRQLHYQKNDIEEANWEYARLLLQVNNYAEAQGYVASLLEKNPNRVDYLLAGGQLAAAKGDWAKAFRLYGKAYELDPGTENGDHALHGAVTSLQRQGKIREALPLLEQLFLRSSEKEELLRQLAAGHRQLGNIEQAKHYYLLLVADENCDPQDLAAASEFFDEARDVVTARQLFYRRLVKQQDSVSLRQTLLGYALGLQQWEEAMTLLTELLPLVSDKRQYLLDAADISWKKLGRADRALGFLEDYLIVEPDSAVVQEQVETIQRLLAADFLAIVENEGASPLWGDLQRITEDRLPIYQEMARILEIEKKWEPLLDVLKIVEQNSSNKEMVAIRAASINIQLGRYQEAAQALARVQQGGTKNKAYYSLLAEVELYFGHEQQALGAFMALLELMPEDITLRLKCLELAGDLGLPLQMVELRRSWSRQQPADMLKLEKVYLSRLAKIGLWTEYRQALHSLLGGYRENDPEYLDLQLLVADGQRLSGDKRGAEQLLRNLLLKFGLQPRILLPLARYSIADRNVKEARAWVQGWRQALVQREGGQSSQEFLQGELLSAQLEKLSGSYEKAAQRLQSVRDASPPVESVSKDLLAELASELSWLYLHAGEYRKAKNSAQLALTEQGFNPGLLVLLEILEKRIEGWDASQLVNKHLAAPEGHLVSREIELAEKELDFFETGRAAQRLAAVGKVLPGSFWVQRLQARAELAGIGTLLGAKEKYQNLLDLYPEEDGLSVKLVELDARSGNYGQALARLSRRYGLPAGQYDALVTHVTEEKNYASSLELARALWGDRQYQRALGVYEAVLHPSVSRVLRLRLAKEDINYQLLTSESNWWTSLLGVIQTEPEVLEQLMSPEFLLHNYGSLTATAANESYGHYRWQLLIDSEYQARKALVTKNYPFAEKSYKKLLEQEKNPQQLIDLANLYGRFGKVRKEAQVYQEIQDQGAVVPELQTSIERSNQLLRPTNSLDFKLSEKQGREGAIDQRLMSFGAGFSFTPNLDSEASIHYRNNQYESIIDNSLDAQTNSFLGDYVYEFSEDYQLGLRAGFDIRDSSSSPDLILGGELKGQFDDLFSGFVSFDKTMIDDTVEAVNAGLSRDNFGVGLRCEIPSGFGFGGELTISSVSDGNGQKRLNGFADYRYFFADMQLSLGYDYLYLQSDDQSGLIVDSLGRVKEDNSGNARHLYWAPNRFIEHRVSLYFQHDFLGYEQQGKRGISYYSLETGLAYEDDQTLSYSGNFQIFLEMSPHFLLKSSFNATEGDTFEERAFFVSLFYRW